MRAVAAQAGITVGNLAYHFPSKRGLARALIASLVEYYQSVSNEYLRSAKGSQGEGFAGLIQWLMSDSVSKETSRLFREFWVMALHDEVIAGAIDGFYARTHETASALLRLAHPGLDSRMAGDIVQLMGAISEGANVMYATAAGSRRTASFRRVSKLAGDLLLRAAREASASAPRRGLGRSRTGV